MQVNGNTNIGNAVTDNFTVAAAIQGTSALIFDGVTNDTNETTFSITDPTADNTITFQNNTGVVPLSTAGNTLFFTTTGATALTLPTTGTLTVNPASGSYLAQVPTTTADNTITPTANSVIGLTVNGTSGTAATALAVSQPGAASGVVITSTNNTATNGLSFSGTFTNLISSTNFTVTNAGNADFAGTLAVNGDTITSDSNLTIDATGYVGIGSGTSIVATADNELYVVGDIESDGAVSSVALSVVGGIGTFSSNGSYTTVTSNTTDAFNVVQDGTVGWRHKGAHPPPPIVLALHRRQPAPTSHRSCR